jgi:predicted Co/Zn/Cd cation transporter (cation efflux family)
MVFGTPSRRYPTILLTLFVLASLTTIVSLIGLILGPFFGSERVAIALYSVLAIGLGLLALVVRRAQVTNDRNK